MMSIIFIIIFLTVFIVLAIMWFTAKANDANYMSLGFMCGLVFVILVSLIADHFTEPVPKAIDVYRGNTTLQITYQDSIPMDTVVVFKQ